VPHVAHGSATRDEGALHGAREGPGAHLEPDFFVADHRTQSSEPYLRVDRRPRQVGGVVTCSGPETRLVDEHPQRDVRARRRVERLSCGLGDERDSTRLRR
jgi:hypothetical protein